MTLPIHSFFGGRSLPHHKDLVFARSLATLPIPQQLHVPLHGHRHEPNLEPQCLVVEEGQWVQAGSPLTRSDDDWHACVHAPLSGVIGAIHISSAGLGSGEKPMLSLACDPDQPVMQLPDDDPPDTDLPRWPSEQVFDHLRNMGVVGLGGAKFPTAEKMRQATDRVDTLILNGVECEPYIGCDEALMRHRPNTIVLGGRLLAHALGAKRLILAVEDPLEPLLGSVLNGFQQSTIPHPIDPDLEIHLLRLPSVFPQGAEKQLIKAVTGLEVPHNKLPRDMGVVCINVATAAATLDACLHNRPLTHRIVSVTGPGVVAPTNVYAPIGTPMHALVEMAGGCCSNAQPLINGGPLSGKKVVDDADPIDKGTLCLLALTKEPGREKTVPQPCINCGFCVEVCPAQLLPQNLFKLLANDQPAKAQALGLTACIECGLCGEVCPSHLPLLDWYRHGKERLRAMDIDEQRQALAKRRHEARLTRLEAKKKAKEAKRKERQARLGQASTAQSEIEAALARARDKKSKSS